MDLFTLAAFTIAYAIAVLVPGPGVAAVVARALGGGFKGAFPMVLGILAGDLVYFVFAVFGLAAIATWFGPIFVIVRSSFLVFDGRARPSGTDRVLSLGFDPPVEFGEELVVIEVERHLLAGPAREVDRVG